MKTKLTILGAFLSIFVLAQEKHKYTTFFASYTKVPSFPITKFEGGTEYAVNVILEFGKASKLQNEIADVKLIDHKKVAKADLTFDITIKEPVAQIKDHKKEDDTYYYSYDYVTTCFIEAKKGGKVVDTVSFKVKGKSIKTISAAPITIVDKYVKSPVFKIKANKAKTKSIATALSNLKLLLSERYAYYKGTIPLTFNEYYKGAQGSTSDYTDLNAVYSEYQTLAKNLYEKREETKTKLTELLTKLDKTREKKKADGKYYYNFAEIFDLDVTKLEILILLHKYKEGQELIDFLNADKKGQKSSASKRAIKNFNEFKLKFDAAKASGIDFKY